MRRLLPWFVLAAVVPSCGGAAEDHRQAAPSPPDAQAPNIDAGVADASDAAIEPRTDYVIVASKQLAAAAERFADYRRKQGHLTVVTSVDTILNGATNGADAAKRVEEHIAARYADRDPAKPFFVLLLGDAAATPALDGSEIPAAEYIEQSDQTKVVTDNTYADVDGDHIPDLALGRIAVATEAEADLVLGKIVQYESVHEVGPWSSRFNMFASTGGFGDFVDQQIEALVFDVLEEIPYDYEVTMTYAKQASPYVFVPEKFSDKVYERMNEGSLMMAYLGHGDEQGFASLSWNSASFPILDTSQLEQKINISHRAPLLTLIACLTGKFTAGKSVSEQILATKTGPVGILSSTEISHPYANAIFVRELAYSLTTGRPKTVGELFLDGKKRMATNTDAMRTKIDGLAGVLLTPSQREALRRSHLYMYELFGDPLLAIAYPQVQAKVTLGAASAKAGTDLTVSSSTFSGSPTGQARITLETQRSVVAGTMTPVPADGDPTRDAVITANYTRANDHSVVEKTIAWSGPTLSTTLAIPSTLAGGVYVVRVRLDDGKQDAVGSAKIIITP